ncbi:hypothetical protein E8E13_007865 [Curvularia kusanoi]|uniref:Uncharacterized protein n=1 Tax=Curvularia kusanoi TaxID=90978 RepID=A0A9P4TJ54_CURKU|nr:hypothetical protein E8E13_007865 [Curvularia kusanoi]
MCTTIECFDRKLPLLRRADLDYKQVTPSGKTTADAIPPYVLLHKEAGSYQKQADHYLQTRGSILRQQQLGTVFDQLNLNTEVDLVLASTLYIIKPILDILQNRYGKDGFTVSSEERTRSEQLDDGQTATRVDLVFRSTSDKKEAILIMEYKRREMIDYDDVEKALLPGHATPNEINAKVAEAQFKGSLLARNALSYTKQLATYADQNTCRFVSLLNWDHLPLFDFNKLSDAAASGTTAGRTAELTWISEEQMEDEFIEQGMIRKALLGFALKAFDNYFVNSDPQ